LVLLLLLPAALIAQQVVNLYPGAIPNSKVTAAVEDSADRFSSLVHRVITPTLEIYLPEKSNATGTAIIICPGGSYKVLVYQGEGVATAKAFAKKGIAAFVLSYRLPEDSFVVNKSIAPLQDAQQAVKMVRDNASKWAVDPNKIGIIGFSAGGHLAATAATHFDKPLIENNSGTSLRPDFLILVYPVVSMQDSLTHTDSRKNLLGSDPTKDTIDLFSNELLVTKQTPPSYLTHAGDDNLVDVENSIQFYQSLRYHKVPAEMHIYPVGGHGFIFRHKEWMKSLLEWMENSKWIVTKK
jgi:acetyl esterase/lipase